ncbi:feruloyl esterase B [Thozetella sp. PMI_491]|nr:feruloyl esterase B [Thozetella sp. PMI_491]
MHVNAFAFLSLHGLAAAATARLQPRQAQGTKPVIACASLKAPAVPGATVVSINATEVHNFELPAGGGLAGVPSAPARENGTATGLSFCDVNVTLTHGNDSVRIEVWLPLENWNGRFQGTGGGGFIAGTFASALAPEVASGYAAASTDAGLRPMSFDGSTIKFDQQLLKNFASLSVHEMAVVGKNLTAAFYGKAPDFSYWNGCSTGGRQGYMEAQRFPDDFDGILAVAPAINWARFVPAEMWPFVLQNSQRDFMPTCVMNAMVAKHVAACDKDDGAEDNVISDPQSCRFDVSTLVGVEVGCNGTTRKVTEQQVDVYKNILAGPTAENGTQLWFGFLPGTNPSALSRQQPFSLASGWINNLVAKSNVAQSVTMTNFSDLFASSEVQFGTILNTDSPDLTAFRNAGGKLLTWQGLSDQLIPPQGTINYRQKVEAMVGDAAAADSFYRLFFAPGVAHCAGGSGAQPVGVLDTLVNWVEKGMAPETLSAKTANSTRNICKYPLTSRYRGSGDVSRAESWDCLTGSWTRFDVMLSTRLLPFHGENIFEYDV